MIDKLDVVCLCKSRRLCDKHALCGPVKYMPFLETADMSNISRTISHPYCRSQDTSIAYDAAALLAMHSRRNQILAATTKGILLTSKTSSVCMQSYVAAPTSLLFQRWRNFDRKTC